MGFSHDPSTLRIVHRAGSLQSLRQRQCNGVWYCIIRRHLPCQWCPECFRDCVVAQENPQMLLPHVATSISFSFPFPNVLLFAEFQWGIFGESPVIFFALLLGK